MKKTVIPVVLAAAVLWLFAGCSKKEAPAAGNSAGSGAAGGGAIRTVQVVSRTAVPFQYLDEATNEYSGYNGDLFKELSGRLKDKYQFEYNIVSTDAVFVGLQTGKYDIAVGNYYTSAERNETFEHSNELTYLSDLRLIVREDETGIKTLDDLAEGTGRILAEINVSDPRYNIIEDYNTAHPDKQITLTPTGIESIADVLKSVLSGQSDAAVYPIDNLNALLAETALPLKTVQTVGIYPVVYYYYRSEANKILRDDIDRVLADLRKEGFLSGLSNKWHKHDPFSLPGADRITEVDFWK
jgi:L-cystine transport system substrate-binding protein